MKRLNVLNTLWNLFLTSGLQLLSLLGVIIGVGFLLGFLQNYSRSFIASAFGNRGFLLTAWIGTPIHEFGHAVMCIVFRHDITDVQWFPKRSTDGHLGYVSHQYNPHSLYQRVGNFFIGVAPVLIGIAVLVGGLYLLVPPSYDTLIHYVQTDVKAEGFTVAMFQKALLAGVVLLKSLWSMDYLISVKFWLFLFLAICISTHIALSTADIKGATDGVIAIFILLIMLNAISIWTPLQANKVIDVLISYNAYVLAFSSIALLFSVLTCVISFSISRVRFWS
ncbi:hypothetical protein [Priestia koreensis]|uniref:hypothetical protein n=1 Tax=Priestia koreensis TaxID=284581 RepID=UPI0028F73A99|nr:hypothetical protein [Priestia koreensis]